MSLFGSQNDPFTAMNSIMNSGFGYRGGMSSFFNHHDDFFGSGFGMKSFQDPS